MTSWLGYSKDGVANLRKVASRAKWIIERLLMNLHAPGAKALLAHIDSAVEQANSLIGQRL